MPPDPPRGPPGLATPTQINATPTSKTVESPECNHRNCTVEMIIGPMKNPVNHKQQGMLGTL